MRGCALLLFALLAWCSDVDDVRLLNDSIRTRGALRSNLARRAALIRRIMMDDPKMAVSLLFPEAEARAIRASAAGQPVEIEVPFSYSGTAEPGVLDSFDEDRAVYFYSFRDEAGTGVTAFDASGNPPSVMCTSTIQASGWRLGESAVFSSVRTEPLPLAAESPCSPSGPQRVAVILVYGPAPGAEAPTITREQVLDTLFGDNPASVATFYRQGSYGKVAMTGAAFGWYRADRTYKCEEFATFAKDATGLAVAAGANLGEFNRMYLLMHTSARSSGCSYSGITFRGCSGLGASSASFGMQWVDTSVSPRTAGHELGHSLTLGHARSMVFAGASLGIDPGRATVSEYGDPVSLMGSGRGHFAAPHKARAGWLAENSGYRSIETSGVFTLETLQASGLNALRVRRRPGVNEWLWVEYRRTDDEFRGWQTPRRAAGVLLRYESADTGASTDLLMANPEANEWELLPGSVWRDDYGPLTLEVADAGGGKLGVAVRYDDVCGAVASLPKQIVLSRSGAPILFDIGASPGCVWTVAAESRWIRLGPATAQVGPGRVTVSAAENGDWSRSGYVTIGGYPIPVRQQGRIATPSAAYVTPDGGLLRTDLPLARFEMDLRQSGDETQEVHLLFGASPEDPRACHLKYDLRTDRFQGIGPDGRVLVPGALAAASSASYPSCNAGAFSFRPLFFVPNEAIFSFGVRPKTLPDPILLFVRFLARDGRITEWTQLGSYTSGAGCSVTFQTGRLIASNSGGLYRVGIEAADGCAWRVTSAPDWATPARDNGTGSLELGFTLAANPGPNDRSGEVTIAGRRLLVWQTGADLSASSALTVLPSELDLPAAGGVVSVAVFDRPHRSALSVRGESSWFSVSRPVESNEGSGNPRAWRLTVTVAENPTSGPRFGGIALGGYRLAVYQAGRGSLRVSPASDAVGPGAASGVLSVIADPDAPWSARSSQDWLQIMDGASGRGRGTLRFTLQANSGAGNRTAHVLVNGEAAAITQFGKAATLPPSYMATPAAGLIPQRDGMWADTLMLDRPGGVAVDAGGNAYASDRLRRMVHRIAPDLTVTRVAGNGRCCNTGSDGAHARDVALNSPDALALDSTGNLYILDRGSCVVRRVDPNGIIANTAGSGACGFSPDGAAAARARINALGIAVAPDGALYIADTNNHRIRRVDSYGVIRTIAGTGQGRSSGDGGPATEAQLFSPEGIAFDAEGNLLVAEALGNRIRRIGPDGIITTLAGTGHWGVSADGTPAASAMLARPTDVKVGTDGAVYIAENAASRIRRFQPGGALETIAGDGRTAMSPARLGLDSTGNLYFTESEATGVGRVSVDAITSRFAGVPDDFGADGPPPRTRLIEPRRVAVDSAGNLYISEGAGRRIHRIAAGVQSVFAGNGLCCTTPEGGPALEAAFNEISDILPLAGGDLLVADRGQHKILRVNNGSIRAIAGTGRAGYRSDNGAATEADLNSPVALAADQAGNVYVADAGNYAVRRIDPSGVITTVAGTGKRGSSADGAVAASSPLERPESIAIDADGALLIAEAPGARRIRRIGSDGMLQTIFEASSTFASGAFVPDTAGGLIYVDDAARTVKRFSQASGVVRIAGFQADGELPDSEILATRLELRGPVSLASASNGKIYLVDAKADRVYLLSPRW